MAYRNNVEAENLRLKAELEELKSKNLELISKAENEEIEKELARLSATGRFKTWLSSSMPWNRTKKEKKPKVFTPRHSKPFRRKRSWAEEYGWSSMTIWHIFVAILAISTTVGIVGYNIYHYFTDINAGYVVGHDYEPEHTTCSRDSDGHQSCTTWPESWSIDIAYEGRMATWHVDEHTYKTTPEGSWHCVTDLIRSECTATEPTR